MQPWNIPGEVVAVVALAVFLGHVFPIFLRFQGGKGVAIAVGVLLGLNLWVGLLAIITWVLVVMIWVSLRYLLWWRLCLLRLMH